MLMCFNYFAWFIYDVSSEFLSICDEIRPSLRLWCHVWAEAVLNYSSSSFFFVLSTTHVLRWPPNIITSKEGERRRLLRPRSHLSELWPELGHVQFNKANDDYTMSTLRGCPSAVLLWCDKYRKIGKVFHRNGSFLVADSCGRSSVATIIISTFVCVVASCGVGEIVIPQEWVAAILLLNTEY